MDKWFPDFFLGLYYSNPTPNIQGKHWRKMETILKMDELLKYSPPGGKTRGSVRAEVASSATIQGSTTQTWSLKKKQDKKFILNNEMLHRMNNWFKAFVGVRGDSRSILDLGLPVSCKPHFMSHKSKIKQIR